jgi:lactoylglutathione lyase
MIQAKSIDHINMIVKDLSESVNFYSDLFGFEIKKDQKEYKSMIIGNDRIKLCLYEDEKLDPGNGIIHFGFYVDNFDQVKAFCEAQKVKMPYGTVEWEKSRSIYIIDPNGYEIELSEKDGGAL